MTVPFFNASLQGIYKLMKSRAWPIVLLLAAILFILFVSYTHPSKPRYVRITTRSESTECIGWWTIRQPVVKAKLTEGLWQPITWEPDPLEPALEHHFYLGSGDMIYLLDGVPCGRMELTDHTYVYVRGWCRVKAIPLFVDGFETGDTSRWDHTTP